MRRTIKIASLIWATATITCQCLTSPALPESSTNGNLTSGAREAGQKHKAQSILIPPPPPVVPLPGLLSPYSGAPVDYFSESDLTKQQSIIKQEILEAKKDVEAREKFADEKRQRSTLFASLYTEGVVSRHELEDSQKDDADAQAQLKQGRRHLDELQNELKQIGAALAKLTKSSAHKASSRSKDKAGLSTKRNKIKHNQSSLR